MRCHYVSVDAVKNNSEGSRLIQSSRTTFFSIDYNRFLLQLFVILFFPVSFVLKQKQIHTEVFRNRATLFREKHHFSRRGFLPYAAFRLVAFLSCQKDACA